MPEDVMRFTLNIQTADADDEARLELARRLRKELEELNEVESVESPTSAVAPRSKAVGIDWQTLMVTFAASGGVLTSLIGAVQGWLTRQEKTSVTLEMDGDKLVITGAKSETQQQLVDAWISRHKAARSKA